MSRLVSSLSSKLLLFGCSDFPRTWALKLKVNMTNGAKKGGIFRTIKAWPTTKLSASQCHAAPPPFKRLCYNPQLSVPRQPWPRVAVRPCSLAPIIMAGRPHAAGHCPLLPQPLPLPSCKKPFPPPPPPQGCWNSWAPTMIAPAATTPRRYELKFILLAEFEIYLYY